MAEAAARLPEAHQKTLAQQLESDNGLSLADVRDVTRERAAAATAELPDGLFEEHASAWQVTVRGHLGAALDAIPVDAGYDELRHAIGDAFAVLEGVDAEVGT